MLNCFRHICNKSKIKRQLKAGGHSACFRGSVGAEAPVEFVETVNHAKYLIPADSQGRLPACGGFAIANYIEWLMQAIGLSIPKGYQIDGEAIWSHARTMFWGGDMSSGLFVEQPIEAAMAMGLIVGSYHRLTAAQALQMLTEKPVPVVFEISSQWPNASHKNGYIKPGGLTAGYHYQLLVGATLNEGKPYIHVLNSWGDYHGWHGIDTLPLEEYENRFCAAIDMQVVLDWPETSLVKR